MAKEEKKAPKLRFNGYTNDWERKKLGILITRVKSYPLSRSVEVKKETDVKYVHYGDIHTNIADEIDKNNNLPFINEIYKEYDELKLDDVIVADASEDYKGIADAAVIISNLPYTIIAGLHTIALRPTSLIKGYFLYHIFKTENFKRFGYKIGTGLKVFGISYNNLAKYKVYYPQEIEEQEKTIGILSNLTNSINLHERKCEELALIKKALLQKLFPKKEEVRPEVRYKNFSDAWEQRKLGDLGKAKSGFGFPESEQGGKEGVPFFKVSDMNLKGNEFEMTTATNYVTHEQISLKKWKPIEEVPAIFFAKVGAAVLLNRKRLCRLPFLLDNNTMAFSFDVQKLDIDFTVSLFSKINLPALAQVGALPSYNTKDVESIKVYIPSLEEQKKIGVYLKKINNLIALHQRKLEKLKQLKKFLLQNRFI